MYHKALDDLRGSTANLIVVNRAVAAAKSHDVQKQKLPRQFEEGQRTFSHHSSPFRLCGLRRLAEVIGTRDRSADYLHDGHRQQGISRQDRG